MIGDQSSLTPLIRYKYESVRGEPLTLALLMKQLANPLSQRAGKWLGIPPAGEGTNSLPPQAGEGPGMRAA